MGAFDDIETPVDKIPVGFGLPNGKYHVKIKTAKPMTKKNGAHSMVLKLVVDDGDLLGSSHDWWLTKPERQFANGKTEQEKTKNLMSTASFLKKALVELGIPATEMAEFDFDQEHADQFIGLTGIVNIYQTNAQKNTNYQSVDFQLDEDQEGPIGGSDVDLDAIMGSGDKDTPVAISNGNGNEGLDTADWGLPD